MKRSEYEAIVDKRCGAYVDMPYSVIALNEEAGEVAGWYKKYVLRGNVTGKLSKDDLKGELGDVIFYLTRIARLNGWTLDDIMETNNDKLAVRDANKMRMVV